jgi:hypothetical protein
VNFVSAVPLPQLPTNRSYKYSPTWPGSLILTTGRETSLERLQGSLRIGFALDGREGAYMCF